MDATLTGGIRYGGDCGTSPGIVEHATAAGTDKPKIIALTTADRWEFFNNNELTIQT